MRLAVLMSLIWRGRGCFCSGRRVSILQPPYVLLLSPRLAAGPAAGSSAFSRSVAQHLLFCASPRLGRLYGKECWLRRPAPPPLLRGQLRPLPLSRGLVLLSPGVAVPAFGSGMACSHSVSAPAFRHIAHRPLCLAPSGSPPPTLVPRLRGRLHGAA